MYSSYSKNVVTAGAAREFGAPDNLNIKLSAAVWIGEGRPSVDNAANTKVHNIRAYNIGAAVIYKKLKISFGYTDNGKSLMNKACAVHDSRVFDNTSRYMLSDSDVGLRPGADSGKIYSAGIAYSFGKTSISAGYFKSIVKFSDKEKSKADIVTLAAEHKLDNILRIYVEYDHIRTDSCDRARIYGSACGLSSTGKNTANIFMIGSKINF
jgi:predicted porin